MDFKNYFHHHNNNSIINVTVCCYYNPCVMCSFFCYVMFFFLLLCYMFFFRLSVRLQASIALTHSAQAFLSDSLSFRGYASNEASLIFISLVGESFCLLWVPRTLEFSRSTSVNDSFIRCVAKLPREQL